MTVEHEVALVFRVALESRKSFPETELHIWHVGPKEWLASFRACDLVVWRRGPKMLTAVKRAGLSWRAMFRVERVGEKLQKKATRGKR